MALSIPADIISVTATVGQQADGLVGKLSSQWHDEPLRVCAIDEQDPAEMTRSFGTLGLAVNEAKEGCLRTHTIVNGSLRAPYPFVQQ